MVERSGRKYVHTGRFQDEEQARRIDHAIRATLVREGIAHTVVKSEVDAIHAFASTLE
jgi:hypothetical protein